MFKFCALFLSSSIAQAVPLAGNIVGHVGGNTQCTLSYDIVHEEKCHPEEVCHEEYEVIVTTTVIEECEDVITKHCHNEHKNVYHTSNVVGHDSSVVGHEVGHSYGHSYHKREAEAAHSHLGSHTHSSGPKCEEHVEKKCHKKPIQDSHKVPHKKCHSKPHCHPIAVQIPREICISLSFSKPRPKH
eukprot:TRINITY_DN527_c0_g1_i6.p1 TRINITY_DN527_c0_g1~~TRINITY_DN527_c0_g1_i6.p1  ORF type:complete len:186 (-),score=55.82 TRINITY_DN527_c0_g1_i6:70-627(-)